MFDKLRRIDDCQGTDIALLDESDIARAPLNGKSPSEQIVPQLKRWLACQGAPVSGTKPELFER